MTDIAPTPQDLATQIAAIEAEQAELAASRVPIDARLLELYGQRSALAEKAAAYIDPATPEGLEALWRAAWDGGRGNSTAKGRLEAYARSFAPEIHTIVWYGTGHSNEVLPAPQVTLTRDQDVSALAEGLLALVRQMAAGHKIGYVALLEHALSEHGIYGLDVKPVGGDAVLHVTRYGHRDDLLKGSLAQVLARAARDHWYAREDGATDEDEIEDDDRGW